MPPATSMGQWLYPDPAICELLPPVGFSPKQVQKKALKKLVTVTGWAPALPRKRGVRLWHGSGKRPDNWNLCASGTWWCPHLGTPWPTNMYAYGWHMHKQRHRLIHTHKNIHIYRPEHVRLDNHICNYANCKHGNWYIYIYIYIFIYLFMYLFIYLIYAYTSIVTFLAGIFTFYVLRAYYESVCHAPMSCRKLQLVVYQQTTPKLPMSQG